MLGQTISHYRITQKLGAGGMGVVYKADDLELERTVALKFLPNEFAITPDDRDRLRREARSASAMDHPNIGVIHGLEETPDHQLFIVMAYYEGETLAQRINRGLIPPCEALDIAIQIADGLAAAHTRRIVHRDIKPSNVILTKDHIAKIVDFGLARVVTGASVTQSASTTGTLPYMAPEQILGEQVDGRSDVWALGVMLVQMITGSHPFLRPNTTSMTFAILNQPPAALDAMPAPVQPLVYRALAKQPSQRHADGSEMLKDLQSARAELTSTPAPAEEPTVTRNVSMRELRQYVENASTPRWGGSQGSKNRSVVLAGILIGSAAILALLVSPIRRHVAGLVYADEKHIAVLPFETSAADPEFAPVAQGLMDSFTEQLSNLQAAQQSLWVVPASMVRNHNVKDPASAYRELGANMVIQGRVERIGRDVALTVNLIDARRLRQIGSAHLEDRSGDLMSLQDGALVRLAGLMRVNADEISRAPAGSVAPNSYQSYLKALGYMQRYDKPGNLDLAVAALQSAVQTDPHFALGFATLGEAYRLKFQVDNQPAWLDQAAASCAKAIALDDRLPAVHVTLAYLNLMQGKYDLSLQQFQKALDINPRDADAMIGMASANEHMGHLEDAEATLKRAIALRPDYWDGYNALGNFYDQHNRVQEAIAQYRQVIKLTPDNPVAYSNLGAEYMGLPDPASAAASEAALQKSIQLTPNYEAYANLGELYMNEKRFPEAVTATRKALELNDKDWRVWANLQLAYVWLKDDSNMRAARAKALPLLEQQIKASPQGPSLHSTLSTYYAEDHLSEKALAHANTALALAPQDPSILADVAETYLLLGDRKRALQLAHDSMKNGSTLLDLQRRPGLTALLADPSFRSNGKQ
jgi:serine/threonine protein kinase/tetratricopeptide (TPR) repeat protein